MNHSSLKLTCLPKKEDRSFGAPFKQKTIEPMSDGLKSFVFYCDRTATPVECF